MAKISPEGLRAPAPFEGLNVNHFKNPKCFNFGVPEAAHRVKRAPGADPQRGDYSLAAAGKGKSRLKCALCSESLPMRNNQGIAEELARITAYLNASDEPSCRNEDCNLHNVPLSLAGEMYVLRGLTSAGICVFLHPRSRGSPRL